MAYRAIRERLQEDYEALVGKGGYEAVGEDWGITGGMAWRIMNEGYWPADVAIRERVILRAREKGVAVRQPGRRRDLFAMPVEELRWRLVNRYVMSEE